MASKNSLEGFKIRCRFEDGKDGTPIDFNNPEHEEKLTSQLIEAVRPFGYVYAGKKDEVKPIYRGLA